MKRYWLFVATTFVFSFFSYGFVLYSRGTNSNFIRQRMDKDVIRIRREQWLQHKQEKNHDQKRPHSGTDTIKSSRASKSSSEEEYSKRRKRVKKNHKPDNNLVIDLLSSDEDEGKVSPSSSDGSDIISTFSIVSYNLWFGPPHQKERMEYIANNIIGNLEPKPVIIGFQEVTAYFQQILFPILEKNYGYTVMLSHSKEEEDREGIQYQCAIAVRTKSKNKNNIVGDIVDSGFLPYANTIMNRGLLWTNVCLHRQDDPEGKLSSKYVLFSTTHLESFLKHAQYDGREQRQDQILQASTFLTDYMSSWSLTLNTAIITGDLNWDDQRKRSKGLDETLLKVLSEKNNVSHTSDCGTSTCAEWKDTWLEAHPNLDGYTYDSKESPMLLGNLRRRFDRCLIQNSPSSSLVVKDVSLIGKEAIPMIQWNKEMLDFRTGQPTGKVRTLPVVPSDHFGLHVTFQNQL